MKRMTRPWRKAYDHGKCDIGLPSSCLFLFRRRIVHRDCHIQSLYIYTNENRHTKHDIFCFTLSELYVIPITVIDVGCFGDAHTVGNSLPLLSLFQLSFNRRIGCAPTLRPLLIHLHNCKDNGPMAQTHVTPNLKNSILRITILWCFYFIWMMLF